MQHPMFEVLRALLLALIEAIATALVNIFDKYSFSQRAC